MENTKYNVLYVDDEQDNLEVFEVNFWKDYNLFLALSAIEGLKILENTPIDLIITDQKMPEMTGIEFLEEIVDKYPDAGRIVLTGQMDAQTVLDAVNKGNVYQYIIKPWNKKGLKKVMDNALQIFQLKKENKNLLLQVQLANKQLEEANSSLAVKVNERTAELNEKNRELKQTLKKLRSTQAQLVHSERLASLGMLSAAIGHEINNPLNYIKGAVEILGIHIKNIMPAFEKLEALDEQKADVAEIKEMIREVRSMNLSKIRQDMNRMLDDMKKGTAMTTNIINSLRAFSRADSDKMEMTDIHKGIDSTLMLLKPKFKYQLIEIEKFYGASPAVIKCFPGQLNQVFMNILSNAVDAITDKRNRQEQKEFVGKITITTELAINSIIITIADNGVGMTGTVRKKIFEPFFTTKEEEKGNGLGMHICQEIIERHEGSIMVESTPEEGSKFSIMVPLG
ncbi:MAG: ATP-binding protein [Cyclobacteriaceae bacterium]|nr:ATP-binding protein [Cyclobacteriaceae bacterium]